MIELGLAFSLHLGLLSEYNEIHPHIRWKQDNFIAGAYYNSTENISPYAGYRFEHNGLGLEIGAVSGYENLGGIIPYVRGTYKNFFIAPAAEGQRTGAVIGYEFKF